MDSRESADGQTEPSGLEAISPTEIASRIGVSVEGCLGILTGFRPIGAPRLVDLRLIRQSQDIRTQLGLSSTTQDDWVLVPASRAAEVDRRANVGDLIVWRSPACSWDAVEKAVAAGASLFVTSELELGRITDAGLRPARVLFSGWGASGIVGQESAVVLLRRLLRRANSPVWVVGGLGPDAVAGAIAAGAAGVLLGDVLWASTGANVPNALLTLLERFDPSDTFAQGRYFDFEVRVYRQLATKAPKGYEAFELECSEDDLKRSVVCWHKLLELLPVDGTWSLKQNLIPIGQSAGLARVLRDRFGHTQAILDHFRDVASSSLEGILSDYPLRENGRLARRFKIRFPLFQGPMSQVSDVPEFIDAIERSGALPWIAFSNMPDYIAEKLLAGTQAALGDRMFGVGLIGMDSNRYRDAHFEMLSENKPPLVMAAAGTVEQALFFHNQGIETYLHTPVPVLLASALKSGVRNFILEGAEAGGHVGKLGLVSLVQYSIEVVLEAAVNGLDLSSVSIVVAGGLSDRHAAHLCAAMLYRLHDLGVAVGLQMGTAYLMTEEAVRTGAASQVFQERLIDSDRTLLLGRTVNVPARVLVSPAASLIGVREDERLRNNEPLKQRKHHYEDDNFGGLRAAAKGERIEFTDETRRHARMVPITQDVQRELGLFHAGQTVALMERVRPALELNLEMCTPPTRAATATAPSAQQPMVDSPIPSRTATLEEPFVNEPIAIIGMGARVADALSARDFWNNIQRKHYAIKEVELGEWDSDLFWDPDPKTPDKTYSKIGGFVRGFEFNRKRFRVPPKVVQNLDKTQLMALEATAEALEDAGLGDGNFDRTRCAVILGNALGGDMREETTKRIRFVEFASHVLSAARAEGLSDEITNRLVERAEREFKATCPPITEDAMPGELANVVAGRISNAFDLGGPTFTTDAACASSLAALHTAMLGLRAGAFDTVITGGADGCMSPATYTKFSKIGALSADISCPFDARANGFVMGEGAIILVLKRLSDAVRDGDRVYAIVRGIGGAADGKGKGITAPNPKGQIRALHNAYADAGVTPQTIGLLEAHGTSTRVGDRVETQSFSSLFENEKAPHPVAIGSVKSNIGHLKSAAGAAGLFKAAMALYHRVLPPTCNVETLHPDIDFDTVPLKVQTELEPWESDRPRRAGVSSFGFGGTNFHVVLEEFDGPRYERSLGADGSTGGNSRQPESNATSVRSSVQTPVTSQVISAPTASSAPVAVDAIGVSAETKDELIVALDGLVQGLALNPEQTYAAARLPNNKTHGQTHGLVRLAIAAPDAPSAAKLGRKALQALEAGKSFRVLENQGVFFRDGNDPDERAIAAGKTAFLYTGQGSQYLNMGADLKDRYPQVTEAYADCDRLLHGHFDKAVSEYVFVDTNSADEAKAAFLQLSQTEITQPAVLTLDAALMRIIESYGLKSDVVAGHSLGEYGACFGAGVLSVEDAIRTVAVRGTAMANASPLEGDSGVMATVPMSAAEVMPHIERFGDRVVIANKNSPKQTIIAGFTAEMLQALAYFEENGVRTIRLPVSHAFHTQIVSPASGPLRTFLDTLDVNAPHTPILTNVDATYYPDDLTAIRDQLSVQLARPVEWCAIVERMWAEGVRTFIEIGPKRALASFVSDNLGDRAHRSYVSNHPKFGGLASIGRLIGACWADGLLDRATVQPTIDHGTPSARQGGLTPHDECVVSGAAVGLPGHDEVFAPTALISLLEGRNMISPLGEAARQRMVNKRIERLLKTSDGRAELLRIETVDDTIQLAGQPGRFDLTEFGFQADHADALDRASQLAVAATIETLKDARVPLVRRYRTTKSGKQIGVGWRLPESWADDTGIIFCSAFAGTECINEAAQREASGESFDRRLVRRVIVLGHGAIAQWIGARGPNVCINTACASTTAGVAMACDWIRLGRARRVLVIGADDVTNDTMVEWVGAGFVAVGAASTNPNVAEAALPFDKRRHGLILGMGAVGLLVEQRGDVVARGLDPVATVLATGIANSAGHPTRLDPVHLAQVMSETVGRAADLVGITPQQMASQSVFVSHETYTPARGGSASGEVRALQATFGDEYSNVLVVNIKGQTGHPMGATLEEAAAVKVLQHGIVPALANHREVDPELGPLNLSTGGDHDRRFAIRLAAGFGSQVAITVYDREAKGESRIADRARFQGWLQTVVGDDQPMALSTWNRNLIASAATAHEATLSIDQFEAARQLLVPQRNTPWTTDIAPIPSRPAAAGGFRVSVAGPDEFHTPAEPTQLPIAVSSMGMLSSAGPAEQGANVPGNGRSNGHVKSASNGQAKTSLGGGRNGNGGTKGLSAGNGMGSMAALPVSALRDRKAGSTAEIDESAGMAGMMTWASNVVLADAKQATPQHTDAAPEATSAVSEGTNSIMSVTWDIAYAALRDELCEKTGYEHDEIESDFELEADLGVDTVKQAEIMSAVREHFCLDQDENFRLGDYPTLKDLADYVMTRVRLAQEALAGSTPVADAVRSPSTQLETIGSPSQPAKVHTSPGQPAEANESPDRAADASESAASWDEAYQTLLKELCDKTGYDADEIEPEFELEADLGVDTVKQAEIMSAVRDRFVLEQDEDFRLADYPTLKDLADYLVGRMSLVSVAPPPETSAVPAGPAPPTPQLEAPLSLSFDQAYGTLLSELCDKTGYDADEIEPDFELEADLGVDTVKQAEIMSAVRDHFELAQDEAFRLADYPTLKDLADYLVAQKSSVVAEAAPQSVATPTPSAPQPTVNTGDTPYDTLLEELCHRTGYDKAALAPDFELTADLGLDAATQLELIHMVGDRLGLSRETDLDVRTLDTLEAVSAYLTTRLAQPTAAAAVEAPIESVSHDQAVATTGQHTFDDTYSALLDELCTKTGYDADEIEPDFELEADLGVDTVKQAEIMSAVRDRFELAPDGEFRLADYPTLKDLAGYLVSRAAMSTASAVRVGTEAPPVVSTRDDVGSALTPPPADAVSFDVAYDALLNELCLKTGYDADEIEPDFELEADLGVDTVKQAEIMSAVRDRFELQSDDEFRLADYPTLTDLASYLVNRSNAGRATQVAPAPNVSAAEIAPAPSVSIPATEKAEENPALPGMLSWAAKAVGTTEEDETTATRAPESEPTKPTSTLVAGSPPKAVAASATLPQNAFGPLAIVPVSMPLAAHDPAALRSLFSGRTVAFYAVDPALVTSLTTAFSEVSAQVVELVGSTEAELESNLAKLPKDKLAIVCGLAASVGDPIYTGRQFFRIVRATMRTIGEENLANTPWLSLTRSGGQLGLDGGAGASTGVVTGMTKALSHEWQSHRVRVVDLAEEPCDLTYARSILTQAFLGSEIELGLSWGRRWVAQEQPALSGQAPTLNHESVFLVTGGGRGITARVALEVARRWRCRLALLGRTKLDARVLAPDFDINAEKARIRTELKATHQRVTPAMVRNALTPLKRAQEVAETLEAIRAEGAEVAYLACDVTDRHSLATTVAEVKDSWGQIDGVIHAAGIEYSKALLDKNETDTVRVLSTKLEAMTQILNVLRQEPLQVLVAFGSVSGRFGNAGQLEYSGANDALAKQTLQLQRQWPGLCALTIDWTAWDDIGMAIHSGTRGLMKARGVDLLPADVGAAMCVDLIAAGTSGEVLVAGSLGDFRRDAAKQPPAPTAAAKTLAAQVPASKPIAHAAAKPAATAIATNATNAPPIHAAGSGLLETVELAADGLSATAGVLLEAEEPYLNDHRINGVCVLPGVMAVEIAAQVCKRLAKDKPYRGVSEMLFDKPAKLHRDAPLQLTVKARRAEVRPDGTVIFEVALTSIRESRTGRAIETDHFRGQFRFGGPGEGPRSPLQVPAAGRIDRGFGRDLIYEHYFHTGTFAILDDVIAVGEEMVLAEGQIGSAPLSTLGNQFLTDPLVTELAFQVGGLFGITRRGVTFLPHRIGRSTKLQNAPIGAPLTARVAIRSVSVERLHFDAEVLTEQGQVVARYSDVELISAGPAQKPKPVLSEMELVIRRLELSELPYAVLADPLQLAAPGEIAEFERKRGDKPRTQWALSRWLIKGTVSDFYRRFYGVALLPTEIEIVKNEFGAPSLRILKDIPKSARTPMLSIAHSGEKAVVVLVPPWRRAFAGVDLERVETRSDRFAKDYFSERERATQAAGMSADQTLTAIWSLKEAASKALGLGTYLDFRKEIEVTDLTAEKAKIQFDGRAQAQLDKLGVSFERAAWSIHDGFATASVELKSAKGGPTMTELASVAALLLHTGHTKSVS